METKRLVDILATSRSGKKIADDFLIRIIDRAKSIFNQTADGPVGDIQQLVDLAEEFQQVRQAYNNQTADIFSRMQVFIHVIQKKVEDIAGQGQSAQKVLGQTWAGVEDVATLLQNFLFVLRHDVDLAFDIVAYLAADKYLLNEIVTRLNDAQFKAIHKVFTHDQQRRERADG